MRNLILRGRVRWPRRTVRTCIHNRGMPDGREETGLAAFSGCECRF